MNNLLDLLQILTNNPLIPVVILAVLIVPLILRGSVRIGATVYGTCIWVCDGDTVYVRINPFRKIKVRIAGEDAPESDQDYGEESREFLNRLLYRKKVSVQIVDRDRYGRYVGIVTSDNRDVTLEILKAGLAWCYYAYLKNLPPHLASAYKKAAYNAKMNRRGLWKASKPVAPWDWRKAQREEAGTLRWAIAVMVLGLSVLFGMMYWLASQRGF